MSDPYNYSTAGRFTATGPSHPWHNGDYHGHYRRGSLGYELARLQHEYPNSSRKWRMDYATGQTPAQKRAAKESMDKYKRDQRRWRAEQDELKAEKERRVKAEERLKALEERLDLIENPKPPAPTPTRQEPQPPAKAEPKKSKYDYDFSPEHLDFLGAVERKWGKNMREHAKQIMAMHPEGHEAGTEKALQCIKFAEDNGFIY